ncbi:MAG: hypothetical protein DRI46_12280 [Chloroflexi bacterium]|nr:MAG: hypothetical protein DRI46_12280 [Chloroflexota bacterium]
MQKRINFLEEALDAMKDLAGDNILFNQKLLDKNAALSLHNEVVTKDNLRMTIRVNAQRIVIEGFQEKTLWKRLKRNWGF